MHIFMWHGESGGLGLSTRSSVCQASTGYFGRATAGLIEIVIPCLDIASYRREPGPGQSRRIVSEHLRPYNAFLRILISAGEASGEMYGAQLIEALRRAAELSDVRSARWTAAAPVPTRASLDFFGVGGERMRAAGCDIVVD